MPKKTGHKIEGRPLTNYDLNEIRRHLAQIEKVDAISDQARDVVETEFPELAHKLPPRSRSSYQNQGRDVGREIRPG